MCSNKTNDSGNAIMMICVNNKSTDIGDTHTYRVMCSNKIIDDGNTNYGDIATTKEDTRHSLSNSRHLLSGCQAVPIALHILGSW